MALQELFDKICIQIVLFKVSAGVADGGNCSYSDVLNWKALQKCLFAITLNFTRQVLWNMYMQICE